MSFYITTCDAITLYNLGAAIGAGDVARPGAQDSIVILMFGQPTVQGSDYGASLYGAHNCAGTCSDDPTHLCSPATERTDCVSGSCQSHGPFVTTPDVSMLTQQFARGYYGAVAFGVDVPGGTLVDRASQLLLVMGTSNHGGAVSSNHAAAWANMVADTASAIQTAGLASQVDVAGGMDIEVDWSTPSLVATWVDSYSAFLPRQLLFNFGDAFKCRSTCDNGWTLKDVWHVSWGAPSAWPFPQAYGPGRVSDWAAVNRYSIERCGCSAAEGSNCSAPRCSDAMQFAGALTEFGSCPCGADLGNTPTEGWTELFSALNSGTIPMQFQQSLRWSTDITWMLK